MKFKINKKKTVNKDQDYDEKRFDQDRRKRVPTTRQM